MDLALMTAEVETASQEPKENLLCFLCSESFSSQELYHEHNISRHTLEQLSRALLSSFGTSKPQPIVYTGHQSVVPIASVVCHREGQKDPTGSAAMNMGSLPIDPCHNVSNYHKSCDGGKFQISIPSGRCPDIFDAEERSAAACSSALDMQSLPEHCDVIDKILQTPAPQKIMSQMMGFTDEDDEWPELGDDITLIDDEDLLSSLDLFPTLLDDFVIELDAREESGLLTVHMMDKHLSDDGLLPSINSGKLRTVAGDKCLPPLGSDHLYEMLANISTKEANINDGKLSVSSTIVHNPVSEVRHSTVSYPHLSNAKKLANNLTEDDLVSDVCAFLSASLCEQSKEDNQYEAISQISHESVHVLRATKPESYDHSSSNDSSFIDVERVDDETHSNRDDHRISCAVDQIYFSTHSGTVLCNELRDELVQNEKKTIGVHNNNQKLPQIFLNSSFANAGSSSVQSVHDPSRYITTVAPSRKNMSVNSFNFINRLNKSSVQTIHKFTELSNSSRNIFTELQCKVTDSGRPQSICVPSPIENSTNKVIGIGKKLKKTHQSISSVIRGKRRRSQITDCNGTVDYTSGCSVHKLTAELNDNIKTRSGRIIKVKKWSDFLYTNSYKDCEHVESRLRMDIGTMTSNSESSRHQVSGSNINSSQNENKSDREKSLLTGYITNNTSESLGKLVGIERESVKIEPWDISEQLEVPNKVTDLDPTKDCSKDVIYDTDIPPQTLINQKVVQRRLITGSISASKCSTKKIVTMQHVLCHLCLQSISSQSELNDHLRTQHSSADQLFSCYCGESFQSKDVLKAHCRHDKCTKDQNNFHCQTCNHQFDREVLYDKHMLILHSKLKHICYVCDGRFASSKSLKNHLVIHDKKQLFVCPYCSKSYWVRGSFNRHFRNHFRKYTCKYCSKVYNSRASYESHVAGHVAGRQLGRGVYLKCTNCGDYRNRAAVAALESHDLSHHKVCLACNRGLYKEYSIRKTVNDLPVESVTKRSQHSRPSLLRPCPHCDVHVRNVSKHIKRVHQQPLVNCNICNALVKKDCLNSHLNRRHSRLSDINCDHCNKTFKSVMSLGEHLARVKKKQSIV